MDEDQDISNADFWKKAGDDLIKQEKYEMAIESYKEALKIDPKYVKVWNNLGYAYSKLGRIGEAKKCKERINALQTHPEKIEPTPSMPPIEVPQEQRVIKQDTGDYSKRTEGESFINKIPGFRSGTPWKMIVAVFGYGIIILLILGLIGSTISPEPQSTYIPTSTSAPSASVSTPAPSASVSKPESTLKPTTITMGERNAAKKALEYLSFMPFSRDGLIKQLEFEGFTHQEAIYGVDQSGANWNKQAALKAKDYLEIMAFSRDGLIKQLEFEGFTRQQAEYGVQAVGY